MHDKTAALPKDYAIIHASLRNAGSSITRMSASRLAYHHAKHCISMACLHLRHSIPHVCMLTVDKITLTLYMCCQKRKKLLYVKLHQDLVLINSSFSMPRTLHTQYINWAWPQRPTPSNRLRTCYWTAVLFYLTSSTFNILHQHTSSRSVAVYGGPLNMPYFICIDLWATNVVHDCGRQTLARIWRQRKSVHVVINSHSQADQPQTHYDRISLYYAKAQLKQLGFTMV